MGVRMTFVPLEEIVGYSLVSVTKAVTATYKVNNSGLYSVTSLMTVVNMRKNKKVKKK